MIKWTSSSAVFLSCSLSSVRLFWTLCALQTGRWWLWRVSISTRKSSRSSESRSPFSSKARKPVRTQNTPTLAHWHHQNIGVFINDLTLSLPPSCLPRLRLFPLLHLPAAIKQFVLVALHTEPERTVQEIDRLYDVFEEVSKKWKNMVRTWCSTGRHVSR